MKGWDTKTAEQKKQAKQNIKYNILFKYILSSQIVTHLQSTKNLLLNKMFTNNIISFHTLPDFYLNAQAANLAVKRQVKNILNQISQGNYYQGASLQSLKSSLYFADGQAIKSIPWFLK